MHVRTLRSSRIIAILFLFAANEAFAQFSGSIGMVSDYRYRGVSLYNKNPAAQITANYDHASGFYAGAFGSTVDIPDSNFAQRWMVYLGHSQRLNSGWSWDNGVLKASLSQRPNSIYHEFFSGLSTSNFNGKIYYSPNYFNQNSRTLYIDLNGNHPLNESLSLVGHMGVLHLLPNQSGIPNSIRYDASIGLGYAIQRWNFSVNWVMVRNTPIKFPSSLNGLVLNGVYAF